MMLYGPITGGMEDYERDQNAKGIWLALHEISHSLLEGS